MSISITVIALSSHIFLISIETAYIYDFLIELAILIFSTYLKNKLTRFIEVLKSLRAIQIKRKFPYIEEALTGY